MNKVPNRILVSQPSPTPANPTPARPYTAPPTRHGAPRRAIAARPSAFTVPFLVGSIALCAILLIPKPLAAQGVVVAPKTVLGGVNGVTRPISNATVTVCAANVAGLPCSPALANTLFKDAALTQPLSNPFTADANGNYNFGIAGGTYTVTETASGFAGYSYQLTVTCAPGACTVTSLTVTGALTVGGPSSLGGATTATIDISTSTLKNSSNTAGHVPRNNGTQYVDAVLGAADLSDGVTGTGAVVRATSPAITTATLTGPTGGLVPKVQVFTSSGTFTIPAGVTAVKVTVVGGGGGGAGCNNSNGPGGSGAATAVKWLSGLTPGNTLTVTIGGGGAGGTGAAVGAN